MRDVKKIKNKIHYSDDVVVTVLFLVIFGFITQMTQKNMERESLQMMRGLAMTPQRPVPFDVTENAPDNIRR